MYSIIQGFWLTSGYQNTTFSVFKVLQECDFRALCTYSSSSWNLLNSVLTLEQYSKINKVRMEETFVFPKMHLGFILFFA